MSHVTSNFGSRLKPAATIAAEAVAAATRKAQETQDVRTQEERRFNAWKDEHAPALIKSFLDECSHKIEVASSEGANQCSLDIPDRSALPDQNSFVFKEAQIVLEKNGYKVTIGHPSSESPDYDSNVKYFIIRW